MCYYASNNFASQSGDRMTQLYLKNKLAGAIMKIQRIHYFSSIPTLTS